MSQNKLDSFNSICRDGWTVSIFHIKTVCQCIHSILFKISCKKAIVGRCLLVFRCCFLNIVLCVSVSGICVCVLIISSELKGGKTEF